MRQQVIMHQVFMQGSHELRIVAVFKPNAIINTGIVHQPVYS